MELIQCPWCRLTVPDNVRTCPHCRHEIRDPDINAVNRYRAMLQKKKEEMEREEEMRREIAAIDALNARNQPPVTEEDDGLDLVTVRVSPDLVMECPGCGRNIVVGEEECPYCETYVRKGRWWIWLIVLAFVLGLLAGIAGMSGSGRSSQSAAETTQQSAAP